MEFSSGLPVAPPIMPGWDGYPIRERFARRWNAPTWVDNDVNLLALAELRTNRAAAEEQDVLYVKMGTGIGAGLVSSGRLHRGRNGCAGDIGHVAVAEAETVICRCGNAGCLEAVAGGAALAREGRRLAEGGGSPLLARTLAETGTVTAADLTAAAERGDAAARALLARAGRLVGTTMATLVSFYNPGLVVLGGGVASAGDYVLAAIRESVYRRSLPLATRTLRIEPSSLGRTGELVGAIHLTLDELFGPARLARWLPEGTPRAGRGLPGRTKRVRRPDQRVSAASSPDRVGEDPSSPPGHARRAREGSPAPSDRTVPLSCGGSAELSCRAHRRGEDARRSGRCG